MRTAMADRESMEYDVVIVGAGPRWGGMHENPDNGEGTDFGNYFFLTIWFG